LALGKICVPDLPNTYFREIEKESQLIKKINIFKVKSKKEKGKSKRREKVKEGILQNRRAC